MLLIVSTGYFIIFSDNADLFENLSIRICAIHKKSYQCRKLQWAE